LGPVGDRTNAPTDRRAPIPWSRVDFKEEGMVRSMATQILQENERDETLDVPVCGGQALPLEGIVLAVVFAVAPLMLLAPRERRAG
jgi:hypothetical protein